MFDLPQPATLGRAIELGDYLRRSPLRLGEAPGHKEWLHFCIATPELHVLLNWSLLDQSVARGEAGSRRAAGERARFLALVCEDQGWTGGFATPPSGDVDAVGGAVRLRIGGASLAFRDGVYVVAIDEPDLGLVADLRFHPVTHPSIVHNFPTGDSTMHWFALPRSWCSGTLVTNGHVHHLRGAAAYHDHNWGSFGWGGDYSWTWGFAVPQGLAEPWSVIFLTMHDRRGRRCEVQGLFVWRHGREKRLFRDRQVTVTREGLMRPREVYKVPGVLRLASPGTATDVPRRLRLEAEAGGDFVFLDYEPRHLAQVLVPNDGDAGLTTLQETAGTMRVEGRIDGEPFGFETPSIVEFLGA
jgi:hypothetical protein